MIDSVNDVLATKASVRQCPSCLAEGYVIDSRIQPDGKIYRRRKCPKCGERWSTVEVRRIYK